jgi:hypothetical protein
MSFLDMDERILEIAARVEVAAHVAAAAAAGGLGLVAEVAQDRVVAATAALGPAHQLEEQPPLVLDDVGRRGLGGGGALFATEPPWDR